MSEDLSPELVDYLVAVFYLTVKRGVKYARVVEISKTLGVAKPTASLMLKKLARRGLLLRGRGGVALSSLGLEKCGALVRRHTIVEELLMSCGVEHDRACDIARRLELLLGEEDLAAIESRLESPKSSCDKLLCRLSSAQRSRRR